MHANVRVVLFVNENDFSVFFPTYESEGTAHTYSKSKPTFCTSKSKNILPVNVKNNYFYLLSKIHYIMTSFS